MNPEIRLLKYIDDHPSLNISRYLTEVSVRLLFTYSMWGGSGRLYCTKEFSQFLYLIDANVYMILFMISRKNERKKYMINQKEKYKKKVIHWHRFEKEIGRINFCSTNAHMEYMYCISYTDFSHITEVR